jgi:hypothetical protein
MTNSLAKLLALATLAAFFAVALPTRAADSNDPVTGLPLLPNLHASNDPMDITICAKKAQANQYFTRKDTVAEDLAWYKAHLAGYRLYHAFWDDRSQDTFWSADGTKGVNITGTPKDDKTFSVMYLQMKTGLTDHERSVFSPSNPSCK